MYHKTLSDMVCNERDREIDLPLIITVVNGHCLLTGWLVLGKSAPTRRQIPQQDRPRVQPGAPKAAASVRPWRAREEKVSQPRSRPRGDTDARQVVIITVLRRN